MEDEKLLEQLLAFDDDDEEGFEDLEDDHDNETIKAIAEGDIVIQ